MPYKSGLVQAAISAIGVVAFLIANLTGSTADPKQKRVTGFLQKTGDRVIVVTEDTARQHTIHVQDSTKIFLNDVTIPLQTLENGRKATIIFYKNKGQLIAKCVEVFPSHSDFDQAG